MEVGLAEPVTFSNRFTLSTTSRRYHRTLFTRGVRAPDRHVGSVVRELSNR